MHSVEDILAQSTNVLPGNGLPETMKDTFQAYADALTGDERFDMYGTGEYITQFETEIAKLFGKEAAVFMPTGTMAQQIALRIWCEWQNNFTVAMHPTAHLVFAEQAGYEYLHHIRRLQFGAPEYLRERVLTADDFEGLGKKPGVILLELPYRPLGGQLPQWDELLAIRSWAKTHDIPLHMDGARIWQCRPFYGKSYQEIASLFDSIYVSFYKDIGGLAGSALLGSADFIKEARLWQIRHGGRLIRFGPYLVSAKLGLKRVLPQIDRWVKKAQEAAEILAIFDRITIRPDPPHVNMFQLYIRGDADVLKNKHLELAKETGTFLFYGLNQTAIPGIVGTEIHFQDNAMKFDMQALRPFIEKLLS